MQWTRGCRKLWESVNGIEGTPRVWSLDRESGRTVWEKSEQGR
jgi:hypothetical protein